MTGNFLGEFIGDLMFGKLKPRLNQSACRNCDRFHDAFACNHQEVSYAKWPKDNHECAPTQTGSVICCTLEAVDIECR
jgi:hypothetical protein